MVILAMSLAFIISAFKIVPDALLQREFRFKLLAKIQAAQVLGYAIATVTAAVLGAGYWSFVVGGLVGPAVSTGLTVLKRSNPFARPRFNALGESLTFSSHIIGTRVAWYCYSNSDFLVAGRVLGQAALGSYNIAWTLANLPVQKITNLAMRVLPSYFSNAQNDEAALRRYVLTITEALLLVTLPACLGLSLLADELVPTVLGQKWVHAVTPLRILALYASFRSITNLLPSLLNVRRASRFVMWNNVAAALYFPVAFYMGTQWGTAGIALMWPLLYPFVAVPLYWRAFREIKMPLRQYLASLWPAVSSASIMTVYLLGLRSMVPPTAMARHSRVILEVLSGAAVYGVAILLLHYPELRRLKVQLRTAT
jgi:PST family polysaccharide transporter